MNDEFSKLGRIHRVSPQPNDDAEQPTIDGLSMRKQMEFETIDVFEDQA
jgi:hypothetical protein